jgi:ABC-type transport system substrate-binding protein
MSLFRSKDPVVACLQGVFLGFIVVLTCGAVFQSLVPVRGQSPSLFSVTLIVPSGANEVRREYANTIVQNMVTEGINANLVVTDFSQLTSRLFARNGAPAGASYAQGGYDIAFIGWGFTAFLPDLRENFDGRSAYVPPSGSNYAYYNSPIVDGIFDKLSTTTDIPTQVQLTHQLQEQIFHDAPYNYIYEPESVVPRASKFTEWGNSTLYSDVTFPGGDLQHWGGGNSLTLAEAGNIFPGSNLNPAITSSSNSYYAFYVLNNIIGGALQEPDPRCGCYIPGTASSITSSPDGLTWTVNIKPGVMFQDGVEVTADDFVFTQYALTNSATASVGLSSNIQYLGSKVTFTFLDGTSHVDDNTSPSVPEADGWWKSTSRYQFQFHLPTAYAFTNQVYAAFAPLPKHIMEKFPFSTWDSATFSTASGPYTYTWDTKQYGGSGTYTAVGPVGAGAYELQSYDFTNNIATLTKFPGYWNASGLEALGQFSIDTYKVQWISSKNAAITALQSGQVDMLDSQFGLARDRVTLEAIPNVNIIVTPELGWQEMGFNMNNPYFGTGAETPLGKSNSAQAWEAARLIRKAISHLIPRDQIVSQMLAGAGYPLAGPLGPGWGVWYDSSLMPDTYDLGAAADALRAAGYTPAITATASVASTTTTMAQSTASISATSNASMIESLSTPMISPNAGTSGTNETLLLILPIVVVAIVAGYVILRKRKARKEGSSEQTRVYE